MLRNVCREGWTNILKERVEVVCNVLFIVNFVSINYEIWREFFIVVTFIEQFVNAGPSLFYIWYKPVEFWFIVILFSSIYISLEDVIVIFEVFFLNFDKNAISGKFDQDQHFSHISTNIEIFTYFD